MNLKTKIFMIISAVFIAYGACCYLIQKFIVFPNFEVLENEQVEKDMERIRLALQNEVRQIDTTCHDWSSWDEAYEFVQTGSSEFIESNLVDLTFVTNRINLLYYLNHESQVVWGKALDLNSMTPFHLPEFPPDIFPKNHPLIGFGATGSELRDRVLKGFLVTGHGLMVVSSRPVLTSSEKGAARGTLIMGRLITEEITRLLNQQTQVQFIIQSLQSNPDGTLSAGLDDKPPVFIQRTDNQLLSVVASYADIMGKPALWIIAEIPRSIVEKGAQSVHASLWMIVAAGLITLITLLLIIEQTAIKPLIKLSSHAKSIRRSKDLSQRIEMTEKNEIGTLSQVFDSMVGELEKAMNRVRKSEEMFRLISENSLALVGMAQGGKFIYANPAAARTAGYGPDEMVGLDLWQLVYPEDRNMLHEKIQQRSAKDPLNNRYEFRYITRKGDVRWLEMLVVPIVYEGKDTVLAHGIDITERKKAEEDKISLENRLRTAEKMESLGMLAGGVAHDLNNVLGALVGYSELMRMEIRDGDPLRERATKIIRSGQRAAEIIQDLLTLTRRGVKISEIVNLNGMIRDSFNLPEFEKLSYHYPDVKIHTDLDCNLLNIRGSVVHLSKTLMNLVSNAAEAIFGPGEIRIRTENRTVEKPIRGCDDIMPGDYVVLSVCDDGKGISSSDIGKIFEPFYTRKVMGRSGTGLGLAVVWGTVKDHNGYIDVKSHEGSGTAFTLYFPVTREVSPEEPQAMDLSRFMGRGESILVVDDVPEQRELAENMLTKIGYHVHSVHSGEKAVDYLKTQTPDILLLDMIMAPGMDGLETYKQILEINPGQKAVIVSGFSETDRVQCALDLGIGSYVGKPYVLEKIGMAIRNELDNV
ncbi:MAG: CHASE4 domain-containing protein [Desulfatirhabdiaceae bacterium]